MLIRWGGKGRGVTYPRNNSLVPSRTCDSTSSRCPNEVAWGGQAEAFYRSMGRSMGRDIPSGSYKSKQLVILETGAGSRKRSHPVSETRRGQLRPSSI